MSFEERASSSAVSLLEALESPAHPGVRIFAAAGGALVTIAMWIVHVYYLDLIEFFMELDRWAKLLLGFVLAPPFVVAFAVGSIIYPQPVEPKNGDEYGPMSTYFYQERASKRRKLLIVAALIAGMNLVLMFIASGLNN
jgi:hypothetical protein